MSKSFYNLFPEKKTLIGMIHLKEDEEYSALERAKREIDILIENGFDAVLVEDYLSYGVDNVITTLNYLQKERPEVIYGLNVLRSYYLHQEKIPNYEWSFMLASQYGAKFIQLDSIVGHLPQDEYAKFINRIRELRKNSDVCILGGVRFKYQPNYLNDLKQEVEIAKAECDAIVTTGEGTGKETPISKLKQMRASIGNDFAFISGAGVNEGNCYDTLLVADAVIVGSYLKEKDNVEGEISAGNVKKISIIRNKFK